MTAQRLRDAVLQTQPVRTARSPRYPFRGTRVAVFRSKSMDSQARELEEGQDITAVLRAEREAEAAVERAKAEAQGILERAREKARRIRARTDRRIANMSAGTNAVTERRIEALRIEEAERREQLSQRGHDPKVIHAAVERVADWLLGGGR